MKMFAHNPLSFTYDPAHKGAPYTLNGRDWLNSGELKEAIAKALHKLNAHKDANTAFDAGSDIPEYHASVKSAKATLTCKKLTGTTLTEQLNDYFSRVASTEFWWVELNDEWVTIYKMNAKTFRRFTEKFAKVNERGVIRYAGTSSKLLAWLDANA